MRRARTVLAFVLASVLAAATVPFVSAPAGAAPPGTPHLPDLQTVIPTGSFSIVQAPTGREFRYTHLIYNAGPGPLEIQPAYDGVTGGYRGTQMVFTHNASGQWSQVSSARVPDTFVFHAEHGHFHFPLATFGLYQVTASGGIGQPVAMSPKVGFCIDDSYIYDSTVEHAGTFIGMRSSCADPTGLRGISVGGADEYDYRDPGQAIPITAGLQGTYWFKAVSDPNNDFVEAIESNNETDVRITITGDTVTAGEVRHPDSTPPAVTMTAPAVNAVVKGTVAIAGRTPVTSPSRVDLVVDGTPAPGTTGVGGLSAVWDTRTVTDGVHWIALRVTDALGRIGTSPVVSVTVANSAAPPSAGALRVVGTASSDGAGARTATVGGLTAGDRLLALVASDGPTSGGQTTAMSTTGLAWTLVRRANTRLGASDIWVAVVPPGATSVSGTATPGGGGAWHASLTMLAFRGARGIGASSTGGAGSGAASAAVTTTTPGSLIVGVGNDWDGAADRTLRAGQVSSHQWVDTSVGDTFWAQSTSAATPAAGTLVTLGTTAPTNHQWNFAAAEVQAADVTPPPPDTIAPTVTLTDPEAGSTVKGIATLGATAADARGVTAVTFYIDGVQLGSPTVAPPFMATWDTTKATKGAHVLGARARDAAGNVGTSKPVTVTVDNSGPAPAPLSIKASASATGLGALSVTGLTTPANATTLVAFVALDGPAAVSSQSAMVSGAGVTWSLVKRANTQYGDAEIWAARTTGSLTNATVTATRAVAGYDGSLTVLAFAGANGTGVAGAAGGLSGAPSIYLPAVQAGSWVFAVGNDWDQAVARTPVAGQVVQRQVVASTVGDTYWVQSTAAPSVAPGLVTIADSAPTTDQFNYAAVEVKAG